jgi:hypothetical protein
VRPGCAIPPVRTAAVIESVVVRQMNVQLTNCRFLVIGVNTTGQLLLRCLRPCEAEATGDRLRLSSRETSTKEHRNYTALTPGQGNGVSRLNVNPGTTHAASNSSAAALRPGWDPTGWDAL